jgi:hypothetical protein
MGVGGVGSLWFSESVWASTGMARDRSSMVATNAATTLVFTSDLYFVFLIINVVEAFRLLSEFNMKLVALIETNISGECGSDTPIYGENRL